MRNPGVGPAGAMPPPQPPAGPEQAQPGAGQPMAGDAVAQQLTQRGVSEAKAAETVARIDANGDGMIHPDELQRDYAHMQARMEAEGPEGFRVVQLQQGGAPERPPADEMPLERALMVGVFGENPRDELSAEDFIARATPILAGRPDVPEGEAASLAAQLYQASHPDGGPVTFASLRAALERNPTA